VRLAAGISAVDLSALPDGMYLLRCGSATVRVVKLNE